MAPNLDSCGYLVDGDGLIGCLMRTLLFLAMGLSAVASTMTADASMQAQVQSYAEMVCGTNLKTGHPEEASAKKRCISGLTKLGKNAFKIAAPSIQKRKKESDFFLCIRGHTTDRAEIKQAAREHGREIKTMPKTPHHIKCPRLDRLRKAIQKPLDKSLFFGQTILKTGDAKAGIYMAFTESK